MGLSDGESLKGHGRHWIGWESRPTKPGLVGRAGVTCEEWRNFPNKEERWGSWLSKQHKLGAGRRIEEPKEKEWWKEGRRGVRRKGLCLGADSMETRPPPWSPAGEHKHRQTRRRRRRTWTGTVKVRHTPNTTSHSSTGCNNVLTLCDTHWLASESRHLEGDSPKNHLTFSPSLDQHLEHGSSPPSSSAWLMDPHQRPKNRDTQHKNRIWSFLKNLFFISKKWRLEFFSLLRNSSVEEVVFDSHVIPAVHNRREQTHSNNQNIMENCLHFCNPMLTI